MDKNLPMFKGDSTDQWYKTALRGYRFDYREIRGPFWSAIAGWILASDERAVARNDGIIPVDAARRDRNNGIARITP